MPENSNRRSALAGHYRPGRHGAVPADGPGVTLAERRGLAVFILDGPAADKKFRTAVAKQLGCGLPDRPNSSTAAQGRVALWIGPDRWQILAPDREIAGLESSLAATLKKRPGALSEVGQARTIIRVSGKDARGLISKGCPLDLHPRASASGDCAQSLMAGMAASLHTIEAGMTFDLQVTRSYGLTLWEWLCDAAAEYGYEVAEALEA